jgi:hypothetical protein
MIEPFPLQQYPTGYGANVTLVPLVCYRPFVTGRYGVDLTAMAAELDPVIGRDDEIRRMIRVLCRRTKNNPVLIGEPGVGKVGGWMWAGVMMSLWL